MFALTKFGDEQLALEVLSARQSDRIAVCHRFCHYKSCASSVNSANG
ncbi:MULTISPECIES: hypothetical protein [Nostoc]|uniref:Uncharacterized protein n=1 Tax=Nostoc paludosum FACHB-159 TaxID=2692908 RepID=A0ABR8K7J7_9NOSO|nr:MULTISPECIES: hypothetical protein [Nostoc]MBD2676725.1 hypothetical protein [Nostoc sp. FACHB-857]MBD2734913.1 hypothetical protein [Nostoc paludosum FACHB-159]